MRQLLLAVPASLLFGCTSTLDANSVNFVANVQATTRSACSIVPTAQAILALVNVIFPSTLPANASIEAANRICDGFLGGPDGEAPAVVGNTATFDVSGVEVTAFIVPED